MDYKKKRKFILICVFFTLIVSLIVVFYLNFNHQNTKLVAIIEQSNKEIQRINLKDVKEAYFIDIDSKYPAKILVEPGQISFFKASCPDKICMHYGKLSKRGQVAICLPAKTVIRIDGIDENIDSITG